MTKSTGIGRGNNPRSWGHHKSGPDHPRWNHGVIVDDKGYRKIRVGVGHPLADPNGYAYEHILVWVSANGKIPEWMEIHHRNGDKKDNRLGNLQILSHRAHMIADGRLKLSDADVMMMRCLYAGGMCLNDLANHYGVAMQTVSKIIRGEKRKTAGGPIERIDHRKRGGDGRFI